MTTLNFRSRSAVEDLKSFMTRAKTFDTRGARFQVRKNVLAVSVSVMGPRGLGDQVPVVLGMRSFGLTDSSVDGLDAVYEMESVTERTARLLKDTTNSTPEFSLPPATISVPWAAVSAPVTGWQHRATLEDNEIIYLAEAGIEELGANLPTNPGESLVAQARAGVWGRLIGDPNITQFPAGATLGAYTLGFTQQGSTTQLHVAGSWSRLSSTHGYILTRQPMKL